MFINSFTADMLRKIILCVLDYLKQNIYGGMSPRATPTAVKLMYFHSASKLAASQMLSDTTAMAMYDHILQHL